MCGICGFKSNRDFNKQAAITTMLASIAHRGRDASRSWSEEDIVLGHCRLSIKDLDSRSDQPMISTDGRYVIVFNGEIFNYNELKASITDFIPRTNSDTEILLELYTREGTECLNKLNGMFAFVVYDRIKKSIFCARDRFGVKPFYYCLSQNGFIFASEAKAILTTPLYQKQLNNEAISDYLSYGYITGSKTVFSGINRLEPAHYMIIDGEKSSKVCYWNLSERAKALSQPSQSEILELLQSSINCRLPQEVSVGCFLSSGIDSTSISLLAKQHTSNLPTFTFGFENKEYDESDFVKTFAANHKLDNTIFKSGAPTIEELQEIIFYFDQPFFDTSTIPFFKLCRMASKYIKTALTGDGGDEIFAGYETRKADLACLIGHKIPMWSKLSSLIASLLDYIPADSGKVSMNYKLKQFFKFAGLSPEESHYSWRLLYTEKEKQQLLSANIRESLGNYNSFSNFERCFAKYSDRPILQQQALVDLNTWLADDILYKADQCAMASTIELRAPFLDYRLAEAAFAIPEKYKFNLLKGKKFLRETLSSVLPANVAKRKKEGFGSPISSWLKGPLKESFFDSVFSDGFSSLISAKGAIEELYKDHITDKRDNSYRLWALFMLSLWQKRWL